MKKTALLATASALSTLLLVGCGGTTPEPKAEAKAYHGTHNVKKSQKEMRHAVKEAGEEAGWRMTEFRSNAMIAEKDDDVVTIHFTKSSVHTEPHNGGLESEIKDALESTSAH